MALIPGTRLGVYEIVAPLGAGGMGEVYRAKDTRLNRIVAIKVLPGGVAHDAERRERFEREAQAIAALNHPSIVTIYAVENSGETSFLAMELVEGRALTDSIPGSGFPLGPLLKIAIPVADAVAAAHQKGITHRDLKPANIMIGAGDHEGRIKVLDFGLAKLTGTSPGADAATVMPTALATGEGRILGTVAYMSPEQAEGKLIDARSDLFSLGVMLYEMATGDRPFKGDTSISIISSIVKDTPKSLTEVNPAMPRDLGRIVRRALAKDPEKRYQTAKDLRNDLEELKASLDSGELVVEATERSQTRTTRGPWRTVAIGALVVAVGAIGVVAVVLRRGSTPASTSVSASPLTMTALTSTGNADLGALSPDGKYVTYVQTDDGQESVWVRQITSGSAVRIVPPAPGVVIFGLTVAPDSSFVDFVRGSAAARQLDLWRVPFLGGQARKLIDDVTSAPGWSPDGKQMAYLINVSGISERRLMVANADGSQPRAIASRKLPARYLTLTLGSRPDVRPVWLPGGQAIAVMGSDEVRAPSADQLLSVNVATGVETELRDFGPGSTFDYQGGWALGRDGQSVIVNRGESGPAQVVTVGLGHGEVVARLTNDLATYAGVSAAGDAIVTTRSQTTSGLWVTDAAGHNARQIGRDVPSEFNGLTWVASTRLMYEAALAGGVGAWSTDVAGGTSVLVVPGAHNPSASADGRALVFGKSGREIWRADGDGNHAARVSGALGGRAQITPDGSKVFYISAQSGTQTLWAADFAGGPPRQVTTGSVSGESAPTVSPDGRYVMFLSGGSAVIIPVGGGDPVHQIALPRTSLRWTPDGRGVTYADATDTNLWVQPIDGGTPRQLTTFADGRKITDLAWSPDGKQLALVRAVTTSDIVLLKGVR